MNATAIVLVAAGAFWGDVPYEPVADCLGGIYDEFRDDFHFEVGSGRGVPGDVVAVPISLVNEIDRPDLSGVGIALYYDPAQLELVTDPVPSDWLSQASPFWWFRALEFAGGTHPWSGVSLSAVLLRQRTQLAFPRADPQLLFILYYRILGKPGTVAGVGITNAARERPGVTCSGSGLSFLPPAGDVSARKIMYALSRLHVPGTIEIEA